MSPVTRLRLDETPAARQPVLTWTGDVDEGADDDQPADQEPERERLAS